MVFAFFGMVMGMAIGIGGGVNVGMRRVTAKIRHLAESHEIAVKDRTGKAVTLNEFLRLAQQRPPMDHGQKILAIVLTLALIASLTGFLVAVLQ